MKLFHKERTLVLMGGIAMKGIFEEEAIAQIKAKEGLAYNMFVDFNKVGGDDFFQEVFTCLSLIDFVGKNEVEGVAFPVKDNCPEDVSLVDLKDQLENDAEYDFLIKKDGSFLKFQLKSAPEKYIKEFNSTYFTKDIISQTSKYRDPEMVLVYLLQPATERASTEQFYKMIDEVCIGIGTDLSVQNIFFFGRVDLQIFECTQVYKKVVRNQISLSDSLAGEIRNHKPF